MYDVLTILALCCRILWVAVRPVTVLQKGAPFSDADTYCMTYM